MKPLVSILIPAFNAEKWIADSIASAIDQTWSKKEVIIVDDGSTDRTLSIARQFASEAVTVAIQSNQGAAAARNKAYALSRGDYVQWLDADDLLAPDKIERQLGAIGEEGANRTLLSAAWGHFIYRTEKAEFKPTSLWCDLSPHEWMLSSMNEGVFMQTSSWLVSRELTEAAGPWNTELLGDDDGEYFCRVIQACDAIRFIPESKVYYRRVPSGRLSVVGFSKKKQDAHFLSMRLHLDYLQAFGKGERERTAGMNYLQRYMIYFFPEREEVVRELEGLAASLGGQLKPPQLEWKYVWIQRIFGWRVAKQSRLYVRRMKSWCLAWYDRTLYWLQNSRQSRLGAHVNSA